MPAPTQAHQHRPGRAVAAVAALVLGAALATGAAAQRQAEPQSQLPALPPIPAPTDGQPRPPQIQLGGVMGSKALLVIDGQTQMLAVGDTARGVRLVALSGDTARIEHQGKTVDLRIGGSPLVLGGGAGGGPGGNTREIVIPVGSGGHYMVNGTINGHAVRFMVDTGATTIAMGRADAVRIGLDPRKGQIGYASTANGMAPMLSIALDSVRIGEVELYNIAAAVTATDMPYVLLGNSYLSRFQIQQNNEVMRLVRRY
jgi:aspartyl protease family protein